MTFGAGATLRQERLRREISLAEISRQTRISERFLAAIENDDYQQLPGLVFARNFVRQYASVLQLDPDPLVAQLPRVDLAGSALPSAPAREYRPGWDPRWNSAFATVAWIVLAGGAAVAAYIHFNRASPTRAEYAAPVQRAPEAPAPKPADKVAAPSAPVPDSATSAPASPAPATEDSHPVRVVLTAKEPSWVQVTADGKVAFTATLQPQESRAVSADDQVKILTGNAGGVDVSLNGKPLDPLGPSGQVRTLRLTAEGPVAEKTPPRPPPPDPL